MGLANQTGTQKSSIGWSVGDDLVAQISATRRWRAVSSTPPVRQLSQCPGLGQRQFSSCLSSTGELRLKGYLKKTIEVPSGGPRMPHVTSKLPFMYCLLWNNSRQFPVSQQTARWKTSTLKPWGSLFFFAGFQAFPNVPMYGKLGTSTGPYPIIHLKSPLGP